MNNITMLAAKVKSEILAIQAWTAILAHMTQNANAIKMFTDQSLN